MNIVGAMKSATGTQSFPKAMELLNRYHGIRFSVVATGRHLQPRSKEESELDLFVDQRGKVGTPPSILFNRGSIPRSDFTKDRSALYATSLNDCTYIGLSETGDVPKCHSKNLGGVSADATAMGDLLREAKSTLFYPHIICTVNKEDAFSMESTAIVALLLGFSMGETWKIPDNTTRIIRVCNKMLWFDTADAPTIENLTTFVAHFFGKKLECEFQPFDQVPTPTDILQITFPVRNSPEPALP
jgi:hypothetical protein